MRGEKPVEFRGRFHFGVSTGSDFLIGVFPPLLGLGAFEPGTPGSPGSEAPPENVELIRGLSGLGAVGIGDVDFSLHLVNEAVVSEQRMRLLAEITSAYRKQEAP